jgi:hypothetical protein
LAALKATDHYKLVLSNLESAQRDLDAQIRRTTMIASDYTTQYRQNEAAKDANRQRISTLQAELDQEENLAQRKELSPQPANDPQVSSFEEWLFSGLLSVTLEVLGLTLTWFPSSGSVDPSSRTVPYKQRPQQMANRHFEYLKAAIEDGHMEVLAGYRQVAKRLQIGSGTARRYQLECQELGYIKNRRLRVAFPPARKDSIP